MRSYIAAECEDSVQIDLYDAAPVFHGELSCWTAELHACAIEQDVNCMAVCQDARHETCDIDSV
jgi:hypothetical protein